MDHPRIQGNWMPADESNYTLEVAPTDRENVLALRDSFDQSNVIYATKKQLHKFADVVQTGRIENLTSR
jgi:hypothetical protein